MAALLNSLVQQVEEACSDRDALAKLGEAVKVSDQMAAVREHLIGHYVDSARRNGASWSQIGGVLGVTKQSAQARYQPYGAAPELVAVTTALTGRARNALDRAAARAAQAGKPLGEGELLDGVLDDPDALASAVLRIAGIKLRRRGVAAAAPAGLPDVVLGPGAGEALNLAGREAHGLGHNYIGTEHVLLGLAMLPEARLAAAMARRTLEVDDLRRIAVERIAAGSAIPARARRRHRTGTSGD